MDISFQTKTIKLIRQIIDRQQSTTPIIPFVPQKPAPKIEIKKPFFPRATPESVGVSSKRLYGFLKELSDNKELDMHSMTVIKNNKTLCAADFGAYKREYWHVTYSLCKSITSLAIGMLIDDGALKLEDRIADIFPTKASLMTAAFQKKLTVENLLKMSSGVLFNEAGSVTETEWVRNFLESAATFESGKGFSYNSMNTYMLSAVVQEKTGKPLKDFLEERLFKPLGITDVFWESSPEGINKGGWGLYIKPEDVAKIGLLVMNSGEWNGRSLVSKGYIECATKKQNKAPEAYGGYDYGYQIWVREEDDSFLFNGMFGQNLIGFKKSGIIVMSNAGNNEFFQVSGFFDTLHKYFGKDLEHEASDGGWYSRLRHLERAQSQNDKKEARQSVKLCRELDKSGYTFNLSETAGLSTMPLILQMAQNNHTKGLSSVSFSLERGRFYIDAVESGEQKRFEVGFFKPAYTVVEYGGEKYMVGVTGRLCKNEDDVLVLKVRLSFVETANSRFIKFRFVSDDKIEAEFYEQPSEKYLSVALDCTVKEYKNIRFLDPVIAKLDSDFIEYKVQSTFHPRLTAIKTHKQEK